ncbi:hypothetical protein ACIA8C_09535 [Nocardia sp. NPDC051321]|uniref:hypothetical protein n=1 Tax=Nocardia sp. NPDC051321 TaxID=3364323 RepID=UPI0037923157
MAQVLTTDAVLNCGHGKIAVSSSAALHVSGNPVLLQGDFATAKFACANSTPPGPCNAFAAFTAGVSTVLKVNGQPVMLASAKALIAPKGDLVVTSPGQTILDAK